MHLCTCIPEINFSVLIGADALNGANTVGAYLTAMESGQWSSSQEMVTHSPGCRYYWILWDPLVLKETRGSQGTYRKSTGRCTWRPCCIEEGTMNYRYLPDSSYIKNI